MKSELETKARNWPITEPVVEIRDVPIFDIADLELARRDLMDFPDHQGAKTSGNSNRGSLACWHLQGLRASPTYQVSW